MPGYSDWRGVVPEGYATWPCRECDLTITLPWDHHAVVWFFGRSTSSTPLDQSEERHVLPTEKYPGPR